MFYHIFYDCFVLCVVSMQHCLHWDSWLEKFKTEGSVSWICRWKYCNCWLLHFLNGQKFLEWDSRLSKLHFLQFSVLMASSSALEVEKFCLQIELLGESVMCVSKLFRSIHYISKFLKCYVVWIFCEILYSLNDLNRVNLQENCAIIESLMLEGSWIYVLCMEFKISDVCLQVWEKYKCAIVVWLIK